MRIWTARAFFVLIVGAILLWIGSRPVHVYTSGLLTRHGQTVPLALLIGDVVLCLALALLALGMIGIVLVALYAAGWGGGDDE